MPSVMVLKRVKEALKLKKNRDFLRRLFRIPPGTKSSDRLRVLNSVEKKQRVLLIHVIHQIVKGEIPMRKEDSSIILQSGKLQFLQKNFLEPEDVKRLLLSTDKEQKEVLGKVNNYHVLLYRLFHMS